MTNRQGHPMTAPKKPEWMESYNCYSLFLGTGLYVTCSLPSSREGERGYIVSFSGRTVIKRFPKIEDAKAAGLRLARRVLTNSLETIAAVEAK